MHTEERGLFMLTRRDVLRHTEHNDNVLLSGELPCNLMITKGSEAPTLFVCEKCQNFILFLKENLKLVSTLVMPEITISQLHFQCQGYLQHAGVEWNRTHSLRCHLHFPPKKYDLPDAIAFWYGCSMGVYLDNVVETAVGIAKGKK